MTRESAEFAKTFAELVAAMEPDETLRHPLRLALRLLAEAIPLGLTRLRLDGIPSVLLEDLSAADRALVAQPADWRDRLLAGSLVDRPDGPRRENLPLIIDGFRIALARYDDYERRLCQAVVSLLKRKPVSPGDKAIRFIDGLFDEGDDRGNPQRDAVVMALARPLSILTGGPGAGKTHAIVALLIAATLDSPDVEIALAAPTGKAAARLKEAIDGQLEPMTRHVDEVDRPHLASLSRLRPTTLHRLLRLNPRSTSRSRRRARLTPVDLLVVDEASMLDLALATKLFEALSPKTRILLVGDGDQLAPVEAGSPFADLCALDERLRDHRPDLAFMTRLTRPRRFGDGSSIGRLAASIAQGRFDPENLGDGSVVVGPIPNLAGLRDRVVAGYGELIAEAQKDRVGLDAVFAAANRFKALTPTYLGRAGVDSINAAVDAEIARRTTGRSHARHYPGQLILVTQNDGDRLFNGDVGVKLEDPDSPGSFRVHFQTAEGTLALPPALLPPHETAFAMTVHKAQGSEFDSLLLLLPDYAGPLLSKRLLYTAATRAKRRLEILADESAIATALECDEKTDFSLLDRFDWRDLTGEPLDSD